MFEGLDEIEWDKLTHAYGPASDVPGLLKDLASTEKSVRDNAIHAFFGNIWHQHTVYEATAYAVPFLIEILSGLSVEDKLRILALLAEIAVGQSYLAVHEVKYIKREGGLMALAMKKSPRVIQGTPHS